MAIVKPKDLTVNFEGAWKELYRVLPRCAIHILNGKKTETIYVEEKMEELEKKHKNIFTIKERSNPEIVDHCIKKSVEAQMENIYLKKELKERTEQWRVLYLRNVRLKEQLYPMLAKANLIEPESLKNDSLQRQARFVNEMINKMYEKNTQYDILTPRKHVHFSDGDRYILGRLLELKILLPKIREKGEQEKKSERKLFKVHLQTITDNDLEFTLDLEVTEKKFEYYKSAYNKGDNISWHGLKMRIVRLNYSYPEGDTREGMTFRYLRKGDKI